MFIALLIKLPLHYKADIEAWNQCEETFLIRAAINDQAEVVGFPVEQGAKIESKDHEGFAALHRAVRHGRRAAFAILLEMGAYLGTRGGNDESLLQGLTPFHEAASYGKESALLVLLDKGVNL